MTAPTQLEAIVESLAAAFVEDPIFTWLIPNSGIRHASLIRFFRFEVRVVIEPLGRVVPARGERGALLELPPGEWRMPLGAQLAHGPTFARVFRHRLLHAFALITTMERRHPREAHYYIPYVGISPDAQGNGLGSALLRETAERCDRERVSAYLEATSEANAALYARHGFEHLGAFTLGSSPPIWPMRRPPGAAHSAARKSCASIC